MKSHTTGEMPNHDGAPSLGTSQPHTPERSTANTKSASPDAESTEPTRSSFGRAVTGASSSFRASTRITSTTATSPANTQRHEKYVVAKPPTSGPTAIAIAPEAATSP